MPVDTLQLRSDQIISIAAITLVLLLYRGFDPSSFQRNRLAGVPTKKVVYSTSVQAVPLFSNTLAIPDATNSGLLRKQIDLSTLSASSAAVIDLGSHAVLFEKNSSDRLLPASTTKLMTALVVRDLYNLDEVITVSQQPDVEGAAIKFFNDEQLTVESLLQALLVQSGNDAAIVLADHHPGGSEGFISEMNNQAEQYSLNNTHFENVTGFDHPNHYSTALDLAILSRVAMTDEVIREIVRQPQALITDVTGNRQHYLYTTNYLLNKDLNVVGIKTGTTEGAGEVLITQIERENIPILIVVMGSEDRYDDTLKLINWTYNHYTWLPFEQIPFGDQE